MNTNKNSYIIIYSAILVVVVAFLLAFVYAALKPQQDINVALDKKKQILASLNIRDLSDADAAAKYTEVVECDEIIDTNATVINKGEKGGENAGFKLNSADLKEGKLAVYVCNVDGEKKYVIPVWVFGALSGVILLSMLTRTPSMAHISTIRARQPDLVQKSRIARLGKTFSRERRFSLPMVLP